MKTTFKKTLAAVSAAAVVATSAAVMAVPASAAGTVTIGTVNLTLDELVDADYQVSVEVTADSSEIESLSMGVTLDDGLTLVRIKNDENASTGTFASSGQSAWYAEMSAGDYLIDGTDGTCATIVVTVTEDAAEGDTYALTGYTTGDTEDASMNGDSITIVSGAINIISTEESSEEESSEEESSEEESSEEESSTAAVSTPTTTTSSSPSTGDALPIAGVAVAVAVIGGVALVSKKRK